MEVEIALSLLQCKNKHRTNHKPVNDVANPNILSPMDGLNKALYQPTQHPAQLQRLRDHHHPQHVGPGLPVFVWVAFSVRTQFTVATGKREWTPERNGIGHAHGSVSSGAKA